jgi:hypothetical protein
MEAGFISREGQKFFSWPRFQPAVMLTQRRGQCVLGLFSGVGSQCVKLTTHLADVLLPAVFSAWYLIKRRENFTLL